MVYHLHVTFKCVYLYLNILVIHRADISSRSSLSGATPSCCLLAVVFSHQTAPDGAFKVKPKT